MISRTVCLSNASIIQASIAPAHRSLLLLPHIPFFFKAIAPFSLPPPLRCRRCPKFCTTYCDIAPDRRRCPLFWDTYRSAGVTAAASGALSRSPGERRAVAAEPACCEAAPLIISELLTLLVALVSSCLTLRYSLSTTALMQRRSYLGLL